MQINNCFIDDKPFAIQKRVNNHFEYTGNLPDAIDAIRKKPYPSKEETLEYFCFSADYSLLYVQRKYLPPSGGRPSDEVLFYRIKCCGVHNYSCELMSDILSDFLYETETTLIQEINSDDVYTLQTFASLISQLNNKEKFESRIKNFLIQISPDRISKKYDHEMMFPNYDRDKTCIFLNFLSRMPITNKNIMKAGRLAEIDFTDFRSKFDLNDICDLFNLSEAFDYKLCCADYLFRNYSLNTFGEAISDEARKCRKIYPFLMNKYIEFLCDGNLDSAVTVRKMIEYDYFSLSTLHENIYKINTVIENSDITDIKMQLECLFLCIVLDRCGDFRPYTETFLEKVRSDQLLREKLIFMLKDDPSYSEMFASYSFESFMKYSHEVQLLKGRYSDKYIHDAFYLGQVSENEYMDHADYRILSKLAFNEYKEFRSHDRALCFFNTCKQKSLRTDIKKAYKKEVRHYLKNKIAGLIAEIQSVSRL